MNILKVILSMPAKDAKLCSIAKLPLYQYSGHETGGS